MAYFVARQRKRAGLFCEWQTSMESLPRSYRSLRQRQNAARHAPLTAEFLRRKGHYVNPFVGGFRCGITAARSSCPKLQMLSATMNRVPASQWGKRHGFRQRPADGCHGW